MLTIALIAVPLLMSGLIFFLGQKLAKQLALITSIVQFGLTVFAAIQLKYNATSMLEFRENWIGPLGIQFSFSLDGISIVLALLVAITTPLIVYSSFGRSVKSPHIFYGLILMMVGAMMGAFAAGDAFIFYLFYEIALIPIYFLILIWGQGDDRPKVTMKFFVYTMFGSLFMLAALLYVYVHTTPKSFGFDAMYQAGQSLSVLEQGLVFAGIFIAFAVKMPIFPFHTWQPSTYKAAPTAGTMLLAAIMLKMATFGLIRLVIPMVPDGLIEYGHWALVFSVIGIVYASLLAMAQKQFKLLIAYSSVAHVGLISAGILSMNTEAIQGGLFEMLSHGILAVGLFYVYDIIETRLGHDEMDKMGGIRAVAPTFAFLYFIIVMGSVALPFTSGFVGEFLLLLGLSQYSLWLTIFGGLTVVLGAVYMLRSFQQMMLGGSNPLTANFAALTRQEVSILSILVVLIIVLGVYPHPIMDLSNQAVESLLANIR